VSLKFTYLIIIYRYQMVSAILPNALWPFNKLSIKLKKFNFKVFGINFKGKHFQNLIVLIKIENGGPKTYQVEEKFIMVY